MEGWVDLGCPAMHRPGVELAISRSQVQNPNQYTTEPPADVMTVYGADAQKVARQLHNRYDIILCSSELLLLVRFYS